MNSTEERADILHNVVTALKAEVSAKQFVDVGAGVEKCLGVSQDRLRVALAVLKEDGYEVYMLPAVHQDPTSAVKTTVKVLAPPGTKYSDIHSQKNRISQIDFREEEQK